MVMTRQTVKTTVYWIATILGPASFVIGGTLALRHDAQVADGLRHLGYPAYFATILGIWKILGAFATVLPGMPRVKEWAYAGFFFELTAAAASHAAAGDAAADIAAPLGFLVLVLTSWALRPASRSLSAAAPARVVTVRPQALAVAAAR
jgi:uncharacterized membrane protein YphA (DoxX/SURF4 family)